MKRIYAVFAASILTLTLFTCLIAQDQPPQMRGPGLERIEQFKKVRLMEVMKLNEETSIRFFVRYNKYTETLRDIQKNHNELIDQLKDLSRSNSSNSEIERTIKDIGMNEEKIAETRSKFLEDLKDVLSIKQIAEYVVFERDFNKNLREIMRDIAKDRWNRPKQ
jgi:hypothetical protein